MRTSVFWLWLGLFGLGAYHGVNPGMGWLFAVALGLQEKSRRALFKALPPIALGHALAIGAIVVPLALLQTVVPPWPLRTVAAVTLVGFGVDRLLRFRHPRWVGMRVGPRDLTLWSFLMASAHGAGLMLAPFVLGWSSGAPAPHAQHAQMVPPLLASELAASVSAPVPGGIAIGVHTVGYLLAMMVVALVVYEKLGLALLRRAWFNLDLLWAAALIAAGVLTLLL
jgi:hypothetical protein